MKVMTIVGTRPEIIRLTRVIAKLDEHCDHVLVHTGQNYDYELNEIFFNELGVRRPDHFLNAAGATAAETMGKVIIESDKVFESEKPEAILILGDTNSAISAIPAKRRKIPIFHMEAGNRSFDLRVPEEINRRIVDHISDINLTYSTIARDYLLREGRPPDQVIKTGSPMREVINFYADGIESSNALKEAGLTEYGYFLVSAHREENVDSDINFPKLVNVINAIAERFGIPVIISTHPRTQKRLERAGVTFHPLVRPMRPFGFLDYLKLQKSARAVLSDSGTITEESSILNFPALTLREAHERPEGQEEGAILMSGLQVDRVLQCLAILESQPRGSDRGISMVADYAADNVSEKVVRIIHSYTNYVNQVVWRKMLD
ncbi:non-hydrolyzing UDP-N-acetylglucosamine 2-epimerase [Devosia sp. Root635]|uniref:non-hydrolyzing UDP-N-acetylglucosamine 2-epimerase n=1 Tax=Devosia sp. Root635 TaxID=1736575 RepID=UPI0006FEE29C|nr:UDP-N-acetyl glucosamine 2-epimerase [Devosia sp. Root635]